MPIDPAFLAKGAEWSVGGVGPAPGAPGEAGSAPASGSSGFGKALADQLGNLEDLQNQASQASQALATGQASDPSAVVMAVERARLAMQLAAQIRTKAVEAVQDVFHTQV